MAAPEPASNPTTTFEIDPRKVNIWRVAAQSVQGVEHERSGVACQDAHSFRILPNGLLVAAIADGAGSASHAELGARTAATAALNAIAFAAREYVETDDPEMWRGLAERAIHTAVAALRDLAADRCLDLRELSTTLTVAIASKDGLAAAQVGDGACVLQDAEGLITAVTSPQIGEHLNETTFLTAPGAVEAAQCAVIRCAVRGIALLTDGIQMLALRMSAGAPHEPFFLPLFQHLAASGDMAAVNAELWSFLKSPRVTSRTTDDLTLLLACCDRTGSAT